MTISPQAEWGEPDESSGIAVDEGLGGPSDVRMLDQLEDVYVRFPPDGGP